MSKKIFKFSVLLVIISIFVSGCTFPWKKKVAVVNQDQAIINDQVVTSSSTPLTKQLKKFLSDSDLKTFLQDHNIPSNYSSSDLVSSALNSPFGNYRADSQDSTASDIVKLNAGYSYSLVRDDVVIAKTSPANDAKIISKITFQSRPQGVLLSGNSLIVYGLNLETSSQSLYQKFRRKNSYTFLKVYDISDPINPKIVRDLNFEGSYSKARLVGDYLYFLTDTPGSYLDGEPLLPRVINNNEVLNPVCGTNANICFAPEVYYFDINYNSIKYTSINFLNIKNNNEPIGGQVYLLDNNQDVYVSLNNIYITYTDSINEYDLEQVAKKELVYMNLSAEDKDKITKIEASPDYILNSNEKKFKVGIIIDNYLNSLNADDKTLILASINDSVKQKISDKSKDAGKTSIYRFALGTKISYEAIGEVNGQIIDKYSMDEDNGFFRIATILKQNSLADSTQSGDFFSNLYVLGKDLKLVGSLENLATTASISAARFTGNRAYLSTTKVDDPLYIIGLSDPAKPVVLGAIKVTGSYSYLFPFDVNGNKLVSFGKNIENNNGDSSSLGGNIYKGLKLSVFNFTDLEKPKELDSYIIGDGSTDSIALKDPETLSYFNSENKNFLSVPIALKENGSLSFAGTYVFTLADNRLILKGKIDHSHGGHFTGSDLFNGFEYYDNTIKRVLYSNDAEDALYSFSNKLLNINKLSDLSSQKYVILTPGSDDYIITQPAENQTTNSNSLNKDGAPSNSGAINGSPLISPEAPKVNPDNKTPNQGSESTSSPLINNPATSTPPAI